MRNLARLAVVTLVAGCAPISESGNAPGEVSTVDDLTVDGSFGAVLQRFWKLNGNALPYSPDLFVSALRGHLQPIAVRKEIEQAVPTESVFDGPELEGKRTFAAAIVPYGRSLERRSTDEAFPRLLVTYALDGIPKGWRNRIFIGYTPRLDQLEIIAPNETGRGNGGYADYLVVKDFRPGVTPTLVKPNGFICNACHKADVPLIGENLWSDEIQTRHYLCTQDGYGCDGRDPAVKPDSGLDPSLYDMVLALAPMVQSYPYEQEVALFSYRTYGTPIYGSLATRIIIDATNPHRVPENQDPLLDRQYLQEGTWLPKVDPKGVQDADWRQTGPSRCRDWTAKLSEHRNPTEEEAREVFSEQCQGCHLSQATSTFSIPPLPFESLTSYVGPDNDKRTPLYLLENCFMPPARSYMRDRDRATLVAYLRNANAPR